MLCVLWGSNQWDLFEGHGDGLLLITLCTVGAVGTLPTMVHRADWRARTFTEKWPRLVPKRRAEIAVRPVGRDLDA